ncbi:MULTISPECIES: hypothetical protein [unclassified Blautia]|uniref:hypothetical protein n=1 Tax=unclassified Blautia TaxID=2648079 RepID=UPI003F897E9B
MKVYSIKDESVAKQLAQLISLNAECVKLQWSRTITDVPNNVMSALETIEGYVENVIENKCGGSLVGELSQTDEDNMISIIKKNPELRSTIGLGVVYAGAQTKQVNDIAKKVEMPKIICDALDLNANTIIF